MGSLRCRPATDEERTEDEEESRRWPFASHDDSDRRSTASLYSDAPTPVSELPSFPRMQDDKNDGGRRFPVYSPYNAARTWGSKSPAFYPYISREKVKKSDN